MRSNCMSSILFRGTLLRPDPYNCCRSVQYFRMLAHVHTDRRRLAQIGADVAQIGADVAQIVADIAQIGADVAQIVYVRVRRAWCLCHY
eukprot:4200339-Pleurochrysis_carterae.AAC.1